MSKNFPFENDHFVVSWEQFSYKIMKIFWKNTQKYGEKCYTEISKI